METGQKRPLGNNLLTTGIVLVVVGVGLALWGYIEAVGGIEAGAHEAADSGILLLGALIGVAGLAFLAWSFVVRYRHHPNMRVG